MRLFNIVFLLLISINSLFAGDPPRKPFVVLKVNGQTYNNGAEITVRPGERIKVAAVLMGGRRDYCSSPQKYANVGKNTVVERSGENGMSFNINGGQFTGEWNLTQEEAIFSSAEALKITPVEGQQLKREAMIEIPETGFSKIYLKVQSKTSWHYSRRTPAGKKEKDETNDGTATFYLVLQSEEGVWYSSNNIIAKGMEDFTVRNELNEVQKFYGLIEKYLLKKDYKNADVQIQNLKNYVAEVKRAIDEAKQENPEYNCEITFIGLPTDLSMEHLNKIQTLSNKWKERYLISQVNADRINNMLLDYQMGFSANVLKSVFKNYINWGSGLPTGVENFLTLYDPSNMLGVIDLPRNVMGWYMDAQSDASILNNQVKTIKKLSTLRAFYLDNMANFVKERKKLQEIIKDLQPIKERNDTLKQYFATISWATWKEKQ